MTAIIALEDKKNRMCRINGKMTYVPMCFYREFKECKKSLPESSECPWFVDCKRWAEGDRS